jgi:hypothetical protein
MSSAQSSPATVARGDDAVRDHFKGALEQELTGEAIARRDAGAKMFGDGPAMFDEGAQAFGDGPGQ